MKNRVLSRYALSCCVASAMLAGCGGLQPPMGAPSGTYDSDARAYHKTFRYTGSEQRFTVPATVTEVHVVARGAAGSNDSSGAAVPARGGRVSAVISVTPGEKLAVFVGGAGDFGGYNGGAAGGTSGGYCHCTPGFAGGGASDVRQGGDTLSDRVIVAAGGGGAGGFEPNLYGPFQLAGGPGGGLIGGAGDGYPSGHAGGGGGGGTQKAGGTGGTAGSFYGYTGEPGLSGALGVGGAGGSGDVSYSGGAGGGGGGGGYYGGGGGGAGGGAFLEYCYECQGGGGGGGSSYIGRHATKGRTWSHWHNATGNGLVVFSWQ